MPGIDRGTDVPNVAPDALRRPSPTVVTGKGGILADAPARRECALAYRVTVDKVLATVAPDAGTRRIGDSHAPDAAVTTRPDMAERYPNRYARPADPPPWIDGPGEHPAIGSRHLPRPRQERAAEQLRRVRPAVDTTWHGTPAVAAELANSKVGGERPAIMSEWAGRSPEQASMSDIGQRLVNSARKLGRRRLRPPRRARALVQRR